MWGCLPQMIVKCYLYLYCQFDIQMPLVESVWTNIHIVMTNHLPSDWSVWPLISSLIGSEPTVGSYSQWSDTQSPSNRQTVKTCSVQLKYFWNKHIKYIWTNKYYSVLNHKKNLQLGQWLSTREWRQKI